MTRAIFRAYYSTSVDRKDRRQVLKHLEKYGLNTKELAPPIWWDKDRADMIKVIPAGSVVVVPSLDRLAWPEKELRRVLRQLHDKGCTLEIDGVSYDLAIAGMIDRVARAKARAQMAPAREARGRGPKPKVTLKTAEKFAFEFAQQNPPITYESLCLKYGISKATALRRIGEAERIKEVGGLPSDKRLWFTEREQK